MHTFKKGDKVTVREGATSVTGRTRPPEEVRTVQEIWDDGLVVLAWQGAPGSVYRPQDLLPYLEVGDRVEVLVSVSRVNQNMVPGSLGTVESAKDRAGAVGVRLDDGRFVSLNPDDAVKVAETERMPVAHMSELQVGDVVETAYSRDTLHAYVTRVKPAPEPEPTYGHGTAYVYEHPLADVPQKRYKGFLSTSGTFYFLTDTGRQGESQGFENFRLED